MYLNDTSEFVHGLSFAEDISTRIYMEDDYLEAFGVAIRRALESVIADDLYVACFSEQPDLLSQWRGYCPAGAGLCLGFDLDCIKEFCATKGYRLEKCLYDHKDQAPQIESLVDRCFEMFPKPSISRSQYDTLSSKGQVDCCIDYHSQTTAGRDKSQADEAVNWLCRQIADLTPLFKNDGFREEAEWRIVANRPIEQVKFRARASFLAPYVELQLLSATSGNALREVIIGPNPNQARAEAAVRKLLLAHGVGNSTVRCSSLPFNHW